MQEIHSHGPDQLTEKGWTVKTLIAHMTAKHRLEPMTRNLIRLAGLHADQHPTADR